MIAQKNIVDCRNDIFQMSAGRCYPELGRMEEIICRFICRPTYTVKITV